MDDRGTPSYGNQMIPGRTSSQDTGATFWNELEEETELYDGREGGFIGRSLVRSIKGKHLRCQYENSWIYISLILTYWVYILYLHVFTYYIIIYIYINIHMGIVLKPSFKFSSWVCGELWVSLKPASRKFRARPAQGFAQGNCSRVSNVVSLTMFW